MWNFIAVIGVLSFLGGIVACLVFLFKRNWKKAKNLAFIAVGGFILFMIGAVNDSNVETSGAGKEVVENVGDAKPDNKPIVEKKKLIVEITEKQHDVTNNKIIVKGTTNIEDGIRIGIGLEWEDKFDLPAMPGFAEIEDGQFEVSLEYQDYIINRNYRLTASMGSYDNERFNEVFGSYERFIDTYETEGTVKKTDIGFVIDNIPLGQIEITDGVTEQEARLFALESLKQEATELSFAHLSKNPDRYAGEYVKYKGEIVQIQEGNGMTVIRLAVTPTSYGYDYNDVIWVEYEGYTDFIDEDIVTIYGTVFGSHSYMSQAGWQISLPAIIADIVE